MKLALRAPGGRFESLSGRAPGSSIRVRQTHNNLVCSALDGKEADGLSSGW